MKKRSTKFDDLFKWRQSKFSDPLTAEHLSVEGLPYDDIPDVWWPLVTAFRKLLHKVREFRVALWHKHHKEQDSFDLLGARKVIPPTGNPAQQMAQVIRIYCQALKDIQAKGCTFSADRAQKALEEGAFVIYQKGDTFYVRLGGPKGSEGVNHE